ncbi:putative late blight resistance protein-like protein R1A-6 [Forsythia ovata]|uniref:Late blight resistance protein-like protein R1A-6 n=1 Tax=Forsythia ovata TaxID=205694 RepID=A0ABD1VMD7_9LAMI
MPDLRYLEIPSLKSSIDTLQNLEFLLVKNGMYIPAYLLNMPKLRHLHVGSPKYPARFSKNCDSSQINSLQTLSFVFIFDSEDEEILRCSPNLRSLKCKSSFYHCPDLNFLTQLESLKMKHDSSFRGSYSRLNFPRNIKKLTLSEFALPREIMSLIGSLPNLEILKLEYAFEGEVWNTKDDEFQKLKFLKLNNLKFEQWNSSSDHFPVLERLVLRYCEKLKIIPSEFSKIPTLQMIEVYQCGEDVDNSALQIHEEQLEYGNEEFKVIITKATRYSFLE